MTTPIAESPVVTTEETLVPIRSAGSAPLDRWVETDPERALKLVESRVQMLEKLRVAAIKATYPSDWVITTSTDGDGQIISQRGYLQDIGAERAGKVWGIEVGNPAIEREDFPDTTYSYHLIAEAWSKVTGERLDYAEGSRWSGDTFFARQVKKEGDKIDPTDVRKAAYANLHGRAVRALSGLNGVPLEILRQAGIDVAKVVHVSYAKGAKGGDSTGASVGSADVTMAWGKGKGKKVAELDDKDLAYYVSAYERDVKDPEKAKYLKNNQRVLDALKAEQERRARTKEQGAETTEDRPSVGPPDGGRGNDEPGTTGGRITQAEVTKFWLAAHKNGWSKVDVGTLLAQEGWAAVDQIPMKAWETVEALLSKPPVKGA